MVRVYYTIVKDSDRSLKFPPVLAERPNLGDWIETNDGLQERKVTRVTVCREYMRVELDNPFAQNLK